MVKPIIFEQPWSPSIDAAKNEFAKLLELYAVQIPQGKGTHAWMNYRDMVGNLLPGNKPAPEAIAILNVVAANAIASVCEQMEAAISGDGPEARGRRAAIIDQFARVLNHSAETRDQARVMALVKGSGTH